MAVADELDDDAIRTGALMITTFLEALRGRVGSAMDHGKQTADLSRKTGQPVYEGFCYELFILGHSWRSLYEDAHRFAAEGVAKAEQYGLATSQAFNRWAQGVAFASNGRYNDAIAGLKDAIAFCERIGDTVVRSRAWNTLGWVHGELYDFERAVEFNQKGLELAVEIGDPEITINAEVNLADFAFATGDEEGAAEQLERLYASLPAVHEWMKWRYSQHVMHSLGEVVLAGGDAERALRLADECLALAEPTESRKNIVKGRRLRGQALLAQGKPDEAEKDVSIAVQVAHQAGNPPQLWKTLAALGDLRRAVGKSPEAGQAYLAALSVIEGVATGLADERLQTTLLGSSATRAIREAADSLGAGVEAGR
jgi:tetratricopeptide (TPR) repeat protein